MLRVGSDDHADAAGKHLGDATALIEVSRNDGAGYLSGYVVECALKSVVLHDGSFDSAAGVHDPTKLADWHRKLRNKPYGHDLLKLAMSMVGPEGAKYLPDLPLSLPTRAAVFDWSETLRYAPLGTVTEDKARAYYEWACLVYEHSIVAMRSDGVI